MVVANHKEMLNKLKKQIRMLQKKEEQSRHQLQMAFKKIQKLGSVYKNKLAKKMRLMHDKMAEAKASSYAKAAADIEHKLMSGIEKKAKAVADAIKKIEKKHVVRLSKAKLKKGKSSKMRKKK